MAASIVHFCPSSPIYCRVSQQIGHSFGCSWLGANCVPQVVQIQCSMIVCLLSWGEHHLFALGTKTGCRDRISHVSLRVAPPLGKCIQRGFIPEADARNTVPTRLVRPQGSTILYHAEVCGTKAS